MAVTPDPGHRKAPRFVVAILIFRAGSDPGPQNKIGGSPGEIHGGIPEGNLLGGPLGGLQSIKLINSIVIRGFGGWGEAGVANQIHTARLAGSI